MIPKTIHYCWFGGNPLPVLAQKCINSWKQYCPNYEIIQWNEENFDISKAPLYVRQAYEAKKWAFVTDYVRLWVVYHHGGIYMDTDVELKKPLDPLLCHRAYFGFEDSRYINTGLGFGAEKGTQIIKELMDDYENAVFLREDGTWDLMPCPKRNTRIFMEHGLVQEDRFQSLPDDIAILPSICLCPIDCESGVRRRSRETISVHWFDASWQSEKERLVVEQIRKQQKRNRISEARYAVMNRILGEEGYRRLKRFLKKGCDDHADD